jgi:hypothetical protein
MVNELILTPRGQKIRPGRCPEPEIIPLRTLTINQAAGGLLPEEIPGILNLFFAEHWKIGTIAQQPGIHPDAVRHALQTDSGNWPARLHYRSLRGVRRGDLKELSSN